MVDRKPLSKEQHRDLVITVIRLSLFVYAFRLLLVVITSGWSTIVDEWQWELGLLLGIFFFMSIAVCGAVFVSRHSSNGGHSRSREKETSSDDD